jgi:hypothetical protein
MSHSIFHTVHVHKMQRVIYFLLFLLLVTSYSAGNIYLQYAPYFISTIILSLTLINISIKKKFIKFKKIIDFLPLLMIFSWFYGVNLGMLNNNNLFFIFSNFAGMSLYFIYYIIVYFKLNPFILFKIVLAASVVNILYSFYFFLISDYINIIGTFVNSYRVYYSGGLMVIAPIISLIIAKYIFRKSEILLSHPTLDKYLGVVFLILAITALVVFSVSKGFFLALVLILLIYIAVIIVRMFLYGRLLKSSFTYLFALIFGIFLIIFFYPSVFDFLVLNFSNIEKSNMFRSLQSVELMKRFSFFGSGLGAAFADEQRGGVITYGFELSYFSLIHKIGILSVAPFFIYIYTCFLTWRQLLKSKDFFYPSLALGSILFLIPSYGNPMLFAPVLVTLHCIALYWLRENTILRQA